MLLHGQVIFEREQTFGGLQLTQEITRAYGLMPEEAEVRKKVGDLPDNYALEVLQPFIEHGVAEVTRALQFFFTSTPYSRVDRICLAGGGCVVPGLVEAIAERTGVLTAILNPFGGMELGASVREKQLRLDAPALLTACGLAMRRFDA
jgi:type IV pilus assembly protein PilM